MDTTKNNIQNKINQAMIVFEQSAALVSSYLKEDNFDEEFALQIRKRIDEQFALLNKSFQMKDEYIQAIHQMFNGEVNWEFAPPTYEKIIESFKLFFLVKNKIRRFIYIQSPKQSVFFNTDFLSSFQQDCLQNKYVFIFQNETDIQESGINNLHKDFLCNIDIINLSIVNFKFKDKFFNAFDTTKVQSFFINGNAIAIQLQDNKWLFNFNDQTTAKKIRKIF